MSRPLSKLMTIGLGFFCFCCLVRSVDLRGAELPNAGNEDTKLVLDNIDRAEDAFASAHYQSAEQVLAPLFKLIPRLSAADQARFFLLEARLQFVFQHPNAARPWFEKLYAVNPSAVLDPVKDPPAAVTIWEEIQAQHAEQHPHQEWFRTMLPLGLAQLHNNEPYKGIAFAVSEGALAGAILATNDSADKLHLSTLLVLSMVVGAIDGIANRPKPMVGAGSSPLQQPGLKSTLSVDNNTLAGGFSFSF